jgi:hypothetical protein
VWVHEKKGVNSLLAISRLLFTARRGQSFMVA